MIVTTVAEAQARFAMRFGRGAKLEIFDHGNGRFHAAATTSDHQRVDGPEASSWEGAIVTWLFPERVEARP